MKRARESLTGGTGDVNPQFWSTSVVQSGNDTTTTLSTSAPPGIGISMAGGRVLAMELLKAWLVFEQGTGGWNATAASFAVGFNGPMLYVLTCSF